MDVVKLARTRGPTDECVFILLDFVSLQSFTGLTSTALPTKAEQTFTGRRRQTATKATSAKTVAAMQGKVCKVAINGFGRIGRNFLRCWHGREKSMLDVVAINDSGGVKQASHLVKYDSVLGTFEADVQIVDDTHISIDGKKIEVVSNRDPLQLPWKALGVDIVIEGTGVFIDTPARPSTFKAPRRLSSPPRPRVTTSRPMFSVSTPKTTRTATRLSPTPRARPTVSRRSSRCSTTSLASSRV